MDLIEKQAAIDVVHKVMLDFFDYCEDAEITPISEKEKKFLEINKKISNNIKNLPSVDAVEVKYGKWKWDFADNGWADWTCSECGWKKNTDIHVQLGYKYCPNCGVKMKVSE